MKINSYKIAWLLIVVLGGAGSGLGIYFLAVKVASQQPQGVVNNVPSYQKMLTNTPGTIKKIQKTPPPQTQNFQEINAPSQENNLSSQEAPVSGLIKAPDKPALPPSEKDIIQINLSSHGLNPTIIKTKILQPLILRIKSQDNDYIFFGEKIGIAEVIRQGQSLTVSFRAPAKTINLRYYYEDYQTRKLIGEGKIIVE